MAFRGSAGARSGARSNRGRESDRLEEEALQMAERLQALKHQMSKEKERMDATQATVGGARWRSARADRGSMRGYAKDVKARQGQKSGSGSRRAPPPPPSHEDRPAVSGSSSAPTHHPREAPTSTPAQDQRPHVSSWEVEDTVSWLDTLGLSQYAAVFRANEISGPILVEVGLDDLDYMEIRVLAHRKRLLKGIEDLKTHGRPTIPAHHSPARGSGGGAMGITSSGGTSSSGSVSGSGGGGESKVHWSMVKPLSENKVEGGADVPVNLADGHYDEAAAQREFQEAVMAWRRAGPATEVVEDGMWTNPFAQPAEPATAGPALLEGELDEEAEHREFAKAVEAWRNGGAATTTGNGVGGGVGVGVGDSDVGQAGNGKDGAAVAEDLARRLDEGFRHEKEELSRKRQEAEERLRSQQRELEEQRAKAREEGMRGAQRDQDMEVRDLESFRGSEDEPEDEDELSIVSQESSDPPTPGDVDVAIVESTLGASTGDLEGDCAYVVEEEDDE